MPEKTTQRHVGADVVGRDEAGRSHARARASTGATRALALHRPAPEPAEETNARTLLGRLAELVLQHRRLVLVAWLLLTIAGGGVAGNVSKRLSVDFSMPGQPGYETAAKIVHIYGNGGNQPPDIAVITAPVGRSIAVHDPTVAAALAAVGRAEPALRVVDIATTGSRNFITDNGRATYALLFSPPSHTLGTDQQVNEAVSVLRHHLRGYGVGLTGLNELSSGGSSSGLGVLAETLVGGAGALLVLAFVFASFLAFVPLLVAAVSILTTFLLILALTYVTEVSFIVQFLVALIGLGVAIDYSLLLVTRWREERSRGADNETAVVRAVETAGRAVLLSGLTVGIGLLALVVLPVPGLRSAGIAGLLIPLVSILVVNTLLPAMLAEIGPRVDWPRLRHEARPSRAWTSWARGVIRWRWAAASLAIMLLGLFALPLFQIKVGETAIDALAKTGSAHVAYTELADGGVPQGVLTPIEVLTTRQAASSVLATLGHVPGVATAVLPAGPTGGRAGTSDIIAVPALASVNDATLAPVRAVDKALEHDPGVIGVTGTGALEQDYSRAVFGHFPLMFGLIALVTFMFLARAFRSPLLAGKAVVLNLLSLAATFGLMTWFWQLGHGSDAVFGITATGAITFWVPLMVFAFLFGLSMDYEVFILTRVREEYDRTGSTNAAVTEGLGRTGRLVTSAALILFLAFASLASTPETEVKVLATGLGAGILLDATVVRALLVPALVSLFGRWNWWFPKPVARLLAVREGTTQPVGPVPSEV